VLIEADQAEIDFLESFGDDLRFLLITSGVGFRAVGESAFRSESIPGLAVEIECAPGEKCERCWNYTADVGQDSAWPGVCARCVEHVRQTLAEMDPA